MLGTETTPEMAKAKELLPMKKQAYEGQAKKDQANTHVNAGMKFCIKNN